MKEFMDLYNLINLIKTTTCFKEAGSCIDLSLPKQKFSFKNANTFEIVLSDHCLLVFLMFKTSFQKN